MLNVSLVQSRGVVSLEQARAGARRIVSSPRRRGTVRVRTNSMVNDILCDMSGPCGKAYRLEINMIMIYLVI